LIFGFGLYSGEIKRTSHVCCSQARNGLAVQLTFWPASLSTLRRIMIANEEMVFYGCKHFADSNLAVRMTGKNKYSTIASLFLL
jgi:hypothetical protein